MSHPVIGTTDKVAQAIFDEIGIYIDPCYTIYPYGWPDDPECKLRRSTLEELLLWNKIYRVKREEIENGNA